MVAIDGARVRAAIEWKGLSVNGAAARMNVSQQTLDSIVRATTKRCYKSLRESLAGLLDQASLLVIDCDDPWGRTEVGVGRRLEVYGSA